MAALEQRVGALENQVKRLEQQRLADKTTTIYPTPQPQQFGTGSAPNYGTGRPARPPAYTWLGIK